MVPKKPLEMLLGTAQGAVQGTPPGIVALGMLALGCKASGMAPGIALGIFPLETVQEMGPEMVLGMPPGTGTAPDPETGLEGALGGSPGQAPGMCAGTPPGVLLPLHGSQGG